MPRLLLVLAFAVAVTAVACTGGNESTSEPTEGTAAGTLLPTERASSGGDLLSYQAAFIGVQDAVNIASLGVVKGLLEFEVCDTEDECVAAGLLVADEYAPYVAVLGEQLEVLNGLNPPATWRTLHDNYTEQLVLRRTAGELWIDGTDTVDEAKLTRSAEIFRESQLVTLDILEDVQDLQYLDSFARVSEDILDWIDGLDDLARDTTDTTLLSDYLDSLGAFTLEIALLDDEVKRLSPPDKYASAHASFKAVVEELHRSQRLRDEGLATGNNSVFVEETTALQAAADSFYDAANRVIDIGEGN